jgi:hypothetical protein
MPSFVNQQSSIAIQFGPSIVRLPAQHNKNASTEELTRPVHGKVLSGTRQPEYGLRLTASEELSRKTQINVHDSMKAVVLFGWIVRMKSEIAF